ncbi:MAG: DUF1326 domain-containing protein [Thermoanaerobaculia bacterium]|nr:DUF1326 domain-containing protein [Thermoanaerobaculia bacterium]
MTTQWSLRGQGYEFCNCDFGCGCNFGGFPNSDDGSCRALVGLDIAAGSCGDVDLAGIRCAAVLAWPKAIHEGGGKAAFIVAPETTEDQAGALGQIFTGQLGGLPWELLGPSFEVVGLEKAEITIEGAGPRSTFRIAGIGEGRGEPLKNPVTGEDHAAEVHLPTGFIWTRGECGSGVYEASAAGLSVASENTNFIFYEFDWSNA